MAAAGGRLLAAAAAYSGRAGWGGLRRTLAVQLVPSRSATVTRSGAILPKPVKTPFGLLRVSAFDPFLYVGTQISKNFAALLEEHDIFVPEDDDDDD
ncbi:LOW QUALITY PROTEIN: essential MCU regulator, mitochondrial [Phoenicopterus ruber ruber]